jgi:hypothetical protein
LFGEEDDVVVVVVTVTVAVDGGTKPESVGQLVDGMEGWRVGRSGAVRCGKGY